MKKIVLKNIKNELENLGASKSTQELILNSVMLYNDLIIEFKESKHNAYLIYQLGASISKQLAEIRKQSVKQTPSNKKSFFEENFDD